MMDFEIMEESEFILLLEEDEVPAEEDSQPEEEKTGAEEEEATPEDDTPPEENSEEEKQPEEEDPEASSSEDEEKTAEVPPIEPIDTRKVLNLFDNYVELYNTTRQLANNVIDLVSIASIDKKESVLKFRNEIILTREQLENVISQKFSDSSYPTFEKLYQKFLSRVEELVTEFASKNDNSTGKQTE